MGTGDLRRSGGGRVAVPSRLGWAVVPQPPPLQGVRREASAGADPIQRRLCLLLQPPPARPLRDHPSPLQRVRPPSSLSNLKSTISQFSLFGLVSALVP